ncbi:hypothetical protein BpHYR1_016834 [Brachionus plicatilis]|uniref:Uncharacterized protein n=1 Tax=Brachionus plicatilis TaxID=10195 RepID=A0A3M7PFY4_BRAPC|nr:hypothetical protein BpHYR1_016834 [Brachionus plicatilis]
MSHLFFRFLELVPYVVLDMKLGSWMMKLMVLGQKFDYLKNHPFVLAFELEMAEKRLVRKIQVHRNLMQLQEMIEIQKHQMD